MVKECGTTPAPAQYYRTVPSYCGDLDDAGGLAPPSRLLPTSIPPFKPSTALSKVFDFSKKYFHENEDYPLSPILQPHQYQSQNIMPLRNWQEKRASIFILAAASITIMLFTVVHLRHLLPRRHHLHVQDCNAFYASDLIECLGPAEEREEPGIIAGKEWL